MKSRRYATKKCIDRKDLTVGQRPLSALSQIQLAHTDPSLLCVFLSCLLFSLVVVCCGSGRKLSRTSRNRRVIWPSLSLPCRTPKNSKAKIWPSKSRNGPKMLDCRKLARVRHSKMERKLPDPLVASSRSKTKRVKCPVLVVWFCAVPRKKGLDPAYSAANQRFLQFT